MLGRAGGHHARGWDDTVARIEVRSDCSALGLQMAYAYDGFGRKTSETDPLGRTWTFPDHDRHGNVETVIDPRGQVTRFTRGLRPPPAQPDGGRGGHDLRAQRARPQ